MTRARRTQLPGDHFEGHYAGDDDPWNYATSWYEQRKYRLTVAALPDESYRTAFEPGCSIGVLTAMLATRCDRLFSVDMTDGAVQRARQRTAGLAHVEVGRMRVPDEWPDDHFDLVVVSELAYYLDETAQAELWSRVRESLVNGGHLVAVHWRGIADDYLVAGGDAVHTRLAEEPGFVSLVHHVEPDFRLEVLERR